MRAWSAQHDYQCQDSLDLDSLDLSLPSRISVMQNHSETEKQPRASASDLQSWGSAVLGSLGITQAHLTDVGESLGGQSTSWLDLGALG